MNRESLSINVFVYITQLGVIYNGARVVVTHLGGFAKEGSFSADFAKQRSCLPHFKIALQLPGVANLASPPFGMGRLVDPNRLKRRVLSILLVGFKRGGPST